MTRSGTTWIAHLRTHDGERESVERGKREAESADRRYWLAQFPEAPTPEGLRRHSERFGPKSVEEIAEAYGVDLTATTPARKPKRLSAGKSKRAVDRAHALLTPDEEEAA